MYWWKNFNIENRPIEMQPDIGGYKIEIFGKCIFLHLDFFYFNVCL